MTRKATRNRKHVVAGVAGLMVVGSLSVVGFSSANAADDGTDGGTVYEVDANEIRETATFWSPTELANAGPMLRTGEIGPVDGKLQSRDYIRVPGEQVDPLHTRDNVPDVDKQNRTIGKIWGVTPGGKTFTCSGSVIQSKNALVIATAAHCLYMHAKNGAPSGRATRLTFAPGFHGGQRQHEYALTNLAISRGFQDDATQVRDDYAFAVARPITKGSPFPGDLFPKAAKPVFDSAVYAGQPGRIAGYSATYPHAGDEVKSCSGGMFPSLGGRDKVISMRGCDEAIATGASGGPLYPDGKNEQIGVISFYSRTNVQAPFTVAWWGKNAEKLYNSMADVPRRRKDEL